MKIALVYDRVNKWGGAERILLALHKIFKNAPLYTSLYHKKNAKWADVFDVKTSFLQKIPKAKNSHEFLAAFMPAAFESFSFDEYDVVISVTSEAAKGIITKPKTLHICICLTPTRYLWSGYDDYFKNNFIKLVSKPVVSYLRSWDKAAAFRPNYLIGISKTVQKRIKNHYGKNSHLIYPPLLINNKVLSQKTKHKLKTKSYFLLVSRLVPYKRIDIAIKAFNKFSVPLKIVGTGRDLESLKKISSRNIQFVGYMNDEELGNYYQNAKALIFPGIEDFGLVMAEAQFFGIPVIAYRDGGAKEIVIEGKTGEFFNKQDTESLEKVLKKFDENRYNSIYCKKNAERFSYERFEKEFIRFFEEKLKEYFDRKILGTKF